jgi:two-component system, sporulation sensor kinase E
VRETINVFMKIARLDSPNFQKGELNEVLSETISEYRRRLPEGVQIKTTFDDSILNVKIDDKHFKEAIFNMFDNAITAMGSQGLLQISTNLEANPLQEYGGSNFAVLEITDSGKGLTVQELENLFTPGYTTSKHGSGMGLVIAKNIVQNHNGDIDVHSSKNVGTTLTIKLPLLEKEK